MLSFLHQNRKKVSIDQPPVKPYELTPFDKSNAHINMLRKNSYDEEIIDNADVQLKSILKKIEQFQTLKNFEIEYIKQSNRISLKNKVIDSFLRMQTIILNILKKEN
jgi:hypothetical protein